MPESYNMTEIVRARTLKIPLEGFVDHVNSDNSMVVRLGNGMTGIIPFHELYDQKPSIPHNRVGTYIKFFVKDIIEQPGWDPLIICSPREYAIDLKNQLWKEYQAGNEVLLRGLVVNTLEKLAFIDIGGGLTGGLFVGDVCKVRLQRIDEMIRKGMVIDVLLKGFDDRQRIQLTTRKLYGDFATCVSKLGLHVGMSCIGTVRGHDPNGQGVFVELLPNLVGLADYPHRFRVDYGDRVTVNVRKIEPEKEGVSLAILGILETRDHTGLGATQRIRVPDVTGMTFQEAKAALLQNNCTLLINTEEFSETVEAGRVTRTSPPVNSFIGPLDRVTIYVSKGKNMDLKMPHLIGLPLFKAQDILTELGVRYTTKREFSAEYDVDIVFETVPKAGSLVKAGEEIIVAVSKGPQVKPLYPVSPFAMRPRERKVLEKVRSGRDFATLLSMFHNGVLQEMDVQILLFIHNHKFIQSNQITYLLSVFYDSEVSQEKVQRRLDKLLEYGLVARYYFMSEEGRGQARAYCMELNGEFFLHEIQGTYYNKQYRHLDQPPYVIKRHLAANQILISYLLNDALGKIAYYAIDKKIVYTVVSKKFGINSHLHALFDQGDRKLDVNFEIVRRPDNANNAELLNKLQRYQGYYETLEEEPNTTYSLVLVGEDEGHIMSLYEEIERYGLFIRNTSILYTCDLQHNPNDLSRLDQALCHLTYMRERPNDFVIL